MKLTDHFTLAEFTLSETAARIGIDNSLPDELRAEAVATCEMLERIREFLGVRAGRVCRMPLTSGYRCMSLNLAVGSSSTSDHPWARAADWSSPDFGRVIEVCRALAPNVSVLGIGQLIYENPSPGRVWVHTSTRIPDKAVNRIISILPGRRTVAGIVEA